MNEPRINLRQVSTRIEVEDYAKIVQLLADPANGHKDVAAYVRTVIHNSLASVELSDASKAWVEQQMSEAANKRASRRHTRRSFISRIFGKKQWLTS